MKNSFTSNIKGYLHHQLSKITYICFSLITLGIAGFCKSENSREGSYRKGDPLYTIDHRKRPDYTNPSFHGSQSDSRRHSANYYGGGNKKPSYLEYQDASGDSLGRQQKAIMPTDGELQKMIELKGDKLCIYPWSGEVYLYYSGTKSINVTIKNITIRRSDDTDDKDYIDAFNLRNNINNLYTLFPNEKKVLINPLWLDSTTMKPGAYAITIELHPQYTEAYTRAETIPIITLTKTIEVENHNYKIQPTPEQLKERFELKKEDGFTYPYYPARIYINYSADITIGDAIELTIKTITIKRLGDNKDCTKDFNLQVTPNNSYILMGCYTNQTLINMPYFSPQDGDKLKPGKYSITVDLDAQYNRRGEKIPITLTKTIEVENPDYKDTDHTPKITLSDEIKGYLKKLEIPDTDTDKLTKAQIATAYKRVARKYHPDKVRGQFQDGEKSETELIKLKAIADAKMKEINEAKEALLKIFTQ